MISVVCMNGGILCRTTFAHRLMDAESQQNKQMAQPVFRHRLIDKKLCIKTPTTVEK